MNNTKKVSSSFYNYQLNAAAYQHLKGGLDDGQPLVEVARKGG